MIRSLASIAFIAGACAPSLLPSPVAAGAHFADRIAPEFETPHDREFDFWLGEWNVLLRIRRDDASWVDGRRALAKIYRVLDGKAVLELWDDLGEDRPIRGFSLRTYDHAANEWKLHLDWPGKNRSGISTLTGTFRHGRGEFFSERPTADGDTLISRYTFCDVAPERIRWDDAYSRDGGKTWSNNWIMEFSRQADRATWPEGDAAHTFHHPGRCDLPEFRIFEHLVGRWEGDVRLYRDGEVFRETVGTLIAYRVLDGCAVISSLAYDVDGTSFEELGFHTFSTYAGALEDARLDNRPGTPLRELFGSVENDRVVLHGSEESGRRERHTWTFGAPDVFSSTAEWIDGENVTLERELEFHIAR